MIVPMKKGTLIKKTSILSLIFAITALTFPFAPLQAIAGVSGAKTGTGAKKSTIRTTSLKRSSQKRASQHQNTQEPLAMFPPQEHFRLGIEAMEQRQWKQAAEHFTIVTSQYPESSYASEAFFHAGVALFHLEEFDLANNCFTDYLQHATLPKNFEEAIGYKYQIAERFREGARCHMFGYKVMPKWSAGSTLALEIYDEVIAALPNHEIGGKALYSKGLMQWNIKQLKDGIETFQKFIKRFPKDELAPLCYLNIAKIYLEQGRTEWQNSDILAFAEINIRRFEEDFPRDPQVQDAKQELAGLKEVYAKGLWETGQFYERIAKPKAAILYYQKTVSEFPETKTADFCRGRLRKFFPNAQV
jgi:outer membrane protein assembly factor BamD (BamD/ComL family)